MKWTATQIKAELNQVYGDSAPALKTVYFWINSKEADINHIWCAFRTTSWSHYARNKIEKESIISSWKMRDIAEIVGISVDRMHNILHKELEMKKLCAWWVHDCWPSIKNAHEKTFCSNVYRCLNAIHKTFGVDSLTIDETWIRDYTPESKQQSKQWNVRRRRRIVLSAGKIMITVFLEFPRNHLHRLTYRRVKQSQKHIIFTSEFVRKVDEWNWDWRVKKSSFIVTTLRLTPPQSQWQNCMN